MIKDSPERAAQIQADALLPSLAPPGRDLTEPLGTCHGGPHDWLHAEQRICVDWVADPWEAAAEAKQEDTDG